MRISLKSFDLRVRLVSLMRDVGLSLLVFLSCAGSSREICVQTVAGQLESKTDGDASLAQLQSLVERTLTNPTPEEEALAERQQNVLVFELTDAGFVSRDIGCPPGGCGGIGDNGSWGRGGDSGGGGEGGGYQKGPDCSENVQKGLNPEGFKKTTYYGKVASTLGVRALTAPGRILTNPTAYLGDMLMVFVSPRIKQSLRNKRLLQGKGFGVLTVITLLPYRMMLNMSVSTLDSFLAYGTSQVDNPSITRDEAFEHASNRLKSNFVSYVVLDSLTSGLDDHLVLDKLVPFLIDRICFWVPNGKFAMRVAQGGVVLAYTGMSTGWELLHYGFIRGVLFKSRDVEQRSTSTPKGD